MEIRKEGISSSGHQFSCFEMFKVSKFIYEWVNYSDVGISCRCADLYLYKHFVNMNYIHSYVICAELKNDVI